MNTVCPACNKGTIDEISRCCNRCKIAVPQLTQVDKPTWTARRRARGDQDRVGAFTELARYKEDHE